MAPHEAAKIYPVTDHTIRKWAAYGLIRHRTQPGKGKQHKRQRVINIVDLQAAILGRKPILKKFPGVKSPNSNTQSGYS